MGRRQTRGNLRKHGIDSADAATVFDDESALTIPDTGFDEDRYATMAVDAPGRILVVAYTWRNDRIRIIPAHKAGPSETRAYGDRK